MPGFFYTLRQLRYFVATVEHGGMAQASRRMNISQPSISSAIKKMEDSLGVQLFIRHHAAGVSLTPAGRRLHGEALILLRHAREFEQNALAESDALAGEIELGCFETVAPAYMPSLLAGFLECYPGVRVNTHDGFAEHLVAGLASGLYDLAIMYDLGLPASLERVPLLPALRPHAVLPKDHPLAQEREVALVQLAAEPMVLLDVEPSGSYFRGLFEAHGLTPNVAYRSPSLEMVRGLVGRKLGYSVLVTRPAMPFTYDGNEVVTIPLADDVQPSNLVMAWHGGSSLTKPAQAFLQHCREHIQSY